jgi:leucyl aminopeptidase
MPIMMRRAAPALFALALFALVVPTGAQAMRPVAFAEQAPQGGALVLPLASAEDLEGRGAVLDAATRAAVGRALTSAEFKFRTGDTLTLRGLGAWTQIIVVGAAGDEPESARLQDIGGIAARASARENGPVALIAGGLGTDAGAPIALGIGARLGSYSFDRYKANSADKPRQPGHDAPLTIVTAFARDAGARWGAEGQALADAVYFARDLITEPANVIYPEAFVARAREAFGGIKGVTIEALDVPQMEKLGMNAILSVGQGSVRPPRLLIVEYKGPGAPARGPIALAGKGITFDSGGISIKPAGNMWRMKGDMAGAAGVVATVLSLARSNAPVHVVALAALAENMPGGSAARPGDVIKAYNGKTIERLNTDAEGRIVLADAVAYAEQRFRPAAIVDVATLTGAIVTALGSDYTGLFSRDESLAAQLLATGTAAGEPLWRMPLHKGYAKAMESPIGDIRDIGDGAPGAGVGAHFIGYFVTPQTPWAHLDIAGTSWRSDSQPTAPAGASGVSVRLLDRFVREYQAAGK